jgi:hypothetical protein
MNVGLLEVIISTAYNRGNCGLGSVAVAFKPQPLTRLSIPSYRWLAGNNRRRLQRGLLLLIQWGMGARISDL